jgi:hypothetical protein
LTETDGIFLVGLVQAGQQGAAALQAIQAEIGELKLRLDAEKEYGKVRRAPSGVVNGRPRHI